MSSLNNDVRERMQEVAGAVQAILPPFTGFVVLAFDLDKAHGRLEYVSNGDREGVVKAMKEFIENTEKGWGEHL